MRKFWQSLSVECSKRILLAILLSSLIVAVISYFGVRASAINEQQKNLDNLLETMQNTARAACFANNEVLAQEVVDGLLRNKLVTGAAIWSDGQLLAQSGLTFSNSKTTTNKSILTQAVLSPFDEKEVIGQIAIQLDKKVIEQQAHRSIRFVGILLATQALLLIIVVSIVVLKLIVRPIERIVAEVEDLSPFDGDMIQPLKEHQADELGLLIEKINQFNQRLHHSYIKEVSLRNRLMEDENRFRSIFELAQTGLFVIDNQAHILSCNACFLNYLGLDEKPNNLFETCLAQNVEKLRYTLEHPENQAEYFELCDTRWLELSLKRINDQSLQGILNDVTSLKVQEQQQRRIALTDALTGINNRRGFDQHIQYLFQSGHRAFALMLVDLDWFKEVNDMYGHAAGDLVLCHTANVLKSLVRDKDYVSRLGGDEFALIIEDCHEIKHPSDIATRIIEHLVKPIAIDDNNQVRIGTSIGITLCDSHYETLEQLFDHADKALYQAKEAGRNCFRFFTA